MKLSIIYTENEVIISKKEYINWQEIQNEFDDFTTSLGPWGFEEVVDYLSNEYDSLNPNAIDQVLKFVDGAVQKTSLTFS